MTAPLLPKSILPRPWTGKPPAPAHKGKNVQPKGAGVEGNLGHKGSTGNEPTGSSVGRPGSYPPHQAKRRA